MAHHYKRYGTTDLFAAMNVVTGEVRTVIVLARLAWVATSTPLWVKCSRPASLATSTRAPLGAGRRDSRRPAPGPVPTVDHQRDAPPGCGGLGGHLFVTVDDGERRRGSQFKAPDVVDVAERGVIAPVGGVGLLLGLEVLEAGLGAFR